MPVLLRLCAVAGRPRSDSAVGHSAARSPEPAAPRCSARFCWFPIGQTQPAAGGRGGMDAAGREEQRVV